MVIYKRNKKTLTIPSGLGSDIMTLMREIQNLKEEIEELRNNNDVETQE